MLFNYYVYVFCSSLFFFYVYILTKKKKKKKKIYIYIYIYIYIKKQNQWDDSTTNVGHREVTSINLNPPSVTCGRMTNTLTHLMSPYYSKGQLNHNLMYTMDHTFDYRSQKFTHTCRKSSAHAHGTNI